MKESRKPVFFILAVIYLIGCPLLLLYTFGYFSDVVRPQPQTSSLYLQTKPQGAAVFLNNSRFKQETPTKLEPLKPGRYRIDLKLPEHETVSYGLSLPPGEQAAITKSLFLPLRPVAKRLVKKKFQDMISLPYGDILILREGETIGDHFFYNFKTGSLKPFVDGGDFPTAAKALSLFTSKGSSAVFVTCNFFGARKYVFLKPSENKVHVRDITDLISVEPDKVLWDRGDPDTLFIFADNRINKLDLRNDLSTEPFLENVRGFGVWDKYVYALSDINNVERYDYFKEDVKTIINDPVLGNFIFGSEGFFTIEPLFKDTIMFFNEDKGEISLNKVPHRFVREGAGGALFDERSRKLLFWKNERIGMLNLGEKSFGFDKTLSVNWFLKGAKDIGQSFWVYDSSHVLLRDRDEVFLFSLSQANLSRLRALTAIKPLSSVHYSESTGVLYYLESSSGNLLALPIVPDGGDR
jgi:hypothetical protein